MKRVWLGILFSIVLWGVMCFFQRPVGASPEPMLLAVFACVALARAIASFIVPAGTARTRIRKIEIKTTDKPTVEGAMFGVEKTEKTIANPEQAVRVALPAYQSSLLVGLALSEVSALCGFAMSRLGFPPTESLPFVLLALVLVGMRSPNADRLAAAIENATGARFPSGGPGVGSARAP